MKSILTSDLMGGILFDIQKERERQEELLRQGKFPWSCDNLGISDVQKLAVLAEEFGEAAKEAAQVQEIYDRYQKGDGLKTFVPKVIAKRKLLRTELIQVAAVCVAWCEALDIQTDDRQDFPADEQASLTTNLAELTQKTCASCGATWHEDTLWCTNCKKTTPSKCSGTFPEKRYPPNDLIIFEAPCELHYGHLGMCGMKP